MDYPAIREAHAACSLEDAADAKAWGGVQTLTPEPAPSGPIQTLRPRSELPGDPLDRLIRRRGSSRSLRAGGADIYTCRERRLMNSSFFQAMVRGTVREATLMTLAREPLLSPGSYRHAVFEQGRS